jgi:cytosine/adenosine deaminase-related metal-dependent hydrolase
VLAPVIRWPASDPRNKDPADVAIEPGKQADVILVDPDALRAYDSEAQTIFEYREAVGSEQMLNRSEGVVTDVWIAGVPAWRDSKATKHLGATRMGQALTITS